MSKYDETDIILRLKDPRQKRRAFEEVVNHYSRTIYWQIRHIVQFHDDTDDVLQNTFLKAWKSIDKFEGNSKISTWLYRIAYNESITFLEQKRETCSLDADQDDDTDARTYAMQLESDEYIDGDKTQMLLQQAIALLPAKQKAVFTMKYFDEMRYEDMSELTGTTVGALKASYHLAVEKITKFFHAHED
jgi:RNA polymerase sigma-70 factor (ECF subfamily)